MSRPPIEQLSGADLLRGVSASRAGGVPLLCWDDEHAWVVTSPGTRKAARDLMGLQRRRGIAAAVFTVPDGEAVLAARPPRCDRPSCIDYPGRHWHDGNKPRYFPRRRDPALEIRETEE